jgi:RNA polymerase primary sigma factor
MNSNIDTMHLYMQNINQYPTLSPEEEIEIGKKILKGDKKAQDWLVKCNLKLVVYIAKRYINASDMSLMDLIQEGNLGLIDAAKKFDYRLGYKFSTYAAFWIKRMITKSLTNDSRMIRLPANIVNQLMKIEKVRKQWNTTHDQQPTNKDIAQMLNMKEEKVTEIIEMAKSPVSLDKPLNEDEDAFIYDIVYDASHQPRNSMRKDGLLAIINSLEPREAKILTMRFGLMDGDNKTLEEVGKTFGLTRERVRQIEHQALRKLRAPSRAKALRELL